MLASILFRVPLVLLPLVDLPAPTRDCLIEPQSYHAADDLALARFDRAVRHYMEVRRRLERPMSPVWMSSDPELRRAAAEALADAIRAARPQARQGVVFSPPVAAAFRYRIEKALRESEEGPPYPVWDEQPAPDLVVNGPFPWALPSTRWPLAWALPVLPEELEYRLVGSSLVLLDVTADLVVDTLPDALPLP
jgi:hypothetical protein